MWEVLNLECQSASDFYTQSPFSANYPDTFISSQMNCDLARLLLLWIGMFLSVRGDRYLLEDAGEIDLSLQRLFL